MTPHQEAHLENLKRRFAVQVDVKYRKGAAEHGGNLWDMGLLKLIDAGIEEAIDQYVYLNTIKDELLTRFAKLL